jgi:hypothetical protein
MRVLLSAPTAGSGTMPEYRAYILGIDGHRYIRVADFLSDHPDDELWERGRLVGRFDHEHGDRVSIVPTQADIRKLIGEHVVSAEETESKEPT